MTKPDVLTLFNECLSVIEHTKDDEAAERMLLIAFRLLQMADEIFARRSQIEPTDAALGHESRRQIGVGTRHRFFFDPQNACSVNRRSASDRTCRRRHRLLPHPRYWTCCVAPSRPLPSQRTNRCRRSRLPNSTVYRGSCADGGMSSRWRQQQEHQKGLEPAQHFVAHPDQKRLMCAFGSLHPPRRQQAASHLRPMSSCRTDQPPEDRAAQRSSRLSRAKTRKQETECFDASWSRSRRLQGRRALCR
jgi:hypothetical protein